MALQTEKARLRRQMKEKLQGLPKNYTQMASRAITAALLALPAYKAAKTIFCYVSVGCEADTRRFITAALAAGKRVCVPKTLGGGAMQARQITGLQNLQPAAFGLQEPPATAPLVPPQQIDLAVLPCLACDAAGVRLGYGGGYYDRYLPQTNSATVCLCYGKLLQKSLPAGALDVPMQTVITEEAVLHF